VQYLLPGCGFAVISAAVVYPGFPLFAAADDYGGAGPAKMSPQWRGQDRPPAEYQGYFALRRKTFYVHAAVSLLIFLSLRGMRSDRGNPYHQLS